MFWKPEKGGSEKGKWPILYDFKQNKWDECL